MRSTGRTLSSAWSEFPNATLMNASRAPNANNQIPFCFIESPLKQLF